MVSERCKIGKEWWGGGGEGGEIKGEKGRGKDGVGERMKDAEITRTKALRSRQTLRN